MCPVLLLPLPKFFLWTLYNMDAHDISAPSGVLV